MSSFAAAYLIVWLATTLYIVRLGLHQHRLARHRQGLDPLIVNRTRTEM